MPALRLHLYKKTEPDLYAVTDPDQHRLYEEVLSFEGGYAFVSEEELTVRKPDGSIFRTAISHYKSDVFTETYLGHFPTGEPFRILFASATNIMAKFNPEVTFAGMSTTEWAVHFTERPQQHHLYIFQTQQR